MTCIAGIADGETVWLGGDSAGTSGWDTTIRTDPKVFRKGPYVIGFTDSFRMGQLLQYSLKVAYPGDLTDEGLHEFMCTEFVDAVRECLKDGGFAETDKDQESGGTFLAGVSGHLFYVGGDYQVGESANGWNAVGCGKNYALGSLHSTSRRGTPETRLKLALEAAASYSNGVSAPFCFVNTAS